MNDRPARAPNHPPLLDRAAHDIGGETAAFQFTGKREEAQAILNEINRQVEGLDSPDDLPLPNEDVVPPARP